jgi:hypothetical protein
LHKAPKKIYNGKYQKECQKYPNDRIYLRLGRIKIFILRHTATSSFNLPTPYFNDPPSFLPLLAGFFTAILRRYTFSVTLYTFLLLFSRVKLYKKINFLTLLAKNPPIL